MQDNRLGNRTFQTSTNVLRFTVYGATSALVIKPNNIGVELALDAGIYTVISGIHAFNMSAETNQSFSQCISATFGNLFNVAAYLGGYAAGKLLQYGMKTTSAAAESFEKLPSDDFSYRF